MDSHVLLWAIQGTLAQDTAAMIVERGTVVASAASIWEIEVKRVQGRLTVPDNFSDLVDETGFERLPVTFEHAVEAARLPLHHRDPFDRMLIAQARLERLTLASADIQVGRYDVATVAAARA